VDPEGLEEHAIRVSARIDRVSEYQPPRPIRAALEFTGHVRPVGRPGRLPVLEQVRKECMRGRTHLNRRLSRLDLNTIERLWAIAKYRGEGQNPESRGELKAVVRNVCYDLTLEIINALAAEMPRCAIEVIRNEGRSIHVLR
jgi:hypothetical protein